MNSIPKTIYIATKNPDKLEGIVRSLKLITENIRILGIDSSIPECKEIGKNSKENAKLKAKYYFRFTQDNTLAEDDSIYFDNMPKQKQPKHLAKSFIQKLEKTQSCWEKFFDEYNLKTGKIIKYFCFVTRNVETKCCKIIIPFRLKMPSYIKESTNFINNFIIPRGFNKTFVQMNETEKRQFGKKYITPGLKKIINFYNQK